MLTKNLLVFRQPRALIEEVPQGPQRFCFQLLLVVLSCQARLHYKLSNNFPLAHPLHRKQLPGQSLDTCCNACYLMNQTNFSLRNQSLCPLFFEQQYFSSIEQRFRLVSMIFVSNHVKTTINSQPRLIFISLVIIKRSSRTIF